MLINSDFTIEEVQKKLKEKKALLECPRCASPKFNIVGQTEISISTIERHMSTLPSMSSVIPTIIIGCENCGFLIQHAIGPLGLSDQNRRRF